MLANKSKHYVGKLSSQHQAARIYDRIQIYEFGIQARTNFSYTKEEVMRILERGNNFEDSVDSMFELSEQEDGDGQNYINMHQNKNEATFWLV